MSYQLRGTAGWDKGGEGLLGLGSDMRWELGYDPARLTDLARLYDEPPMDDPDCQLTPEDLEQPVLSISAEPHSILTVEELEREMDLELPTAIAAALRDQREHHVAGRLGEDAGDVRERLEMFREIELRSYLASLQRFLERPDG